MTATTLLARSGNGPTSLLRRDHSGAGDGHVADGQTVPAGHDAAARWRPGVPLLLVLLVLLPMLATATLTTSSAISQWSSRQKAEVVAADATALQTVALARAQVNDIRIPVMAVAFAHQVGIATSLMSSLLNIDFTTAIQTSAQTIRANPTFSSTPTLRADSADFLAIIPKVLDNTVPYPTVRDLSTQFALDVDHLWYADYNDLQNELATWQPKGSFTVQLNAARQTYAAFINGGYELEGAINLLENEGGVGAREELLQSSGVFAEATSQFTGHLGPNGAAAWNTLQSNPQDRGFTQVLQQAIGIFLAGSSYTGSVTPAQVGVDMNDGLHYLGDLDGLARAASEDLHDSALAQAGAATHQLVGELVFLLLLALASVLGVYFAGRSLTRPLRRLAAAAHQVHNGDFDLAELSTTGPREVATTTEAFNEMTSTLKAVEAKTIALAAENLTHPELQVPLPGRTGMALQATVDRLASRIRERELQRQQLHAAATHDRLTGLWNRGAVFEFLTNDVRRRRQSGETVAVLFADLDGLKPLNDAYGHEAGDAAIKATAEALLSVTGDCDMVARLGGDEFLVVLCSADSADGMMTAERIRAAVADTSITVKGTRVLLQCSVGVALTECDANTDPMDLVRQADQAMYEAKKAARARRDFIEAQRRRQAGVV